MLVAQRSVLLLIAEQLAKLVLGSRLQPLDTVDFLVGHLTAGLAMATFVIVMARMFFYGSIECLVPAEWPEPWERAAEAYCFMEGAYAVPRANLNKTGPEAWDVKVPQAYYYWLPMILVGLAVILKAPDLLWDLYCQYADEQPNETLGAAAQLTAKTSEAAGQEEADKAARMLGAHLLSGRDAQGADFTGARLFLAYLASKALRVTASLGSLGYLQRSFGLQSPLFGLLAWVRDGVEEEPTDWFPTLTFCDVPLRQLAGWNVRVLQCVLPINLLLNKIAVFFWFWLAGCGLLCLASAIVWLVRVASEARRRRYVKTFVGVLLARRQRWRGEAADPALIRTLSSVDRVFTLRLIQEQLGMSAAYGVMEAMTQRLAVQSSADSL